ncbi:MAG: hypothetical protein QXL47_02140 [Candidatus Anstonellales archaeon]
MYVQETFNRAFKLTRKYWMNIILFTVPMLAFYAVATTLAGIMYTGSFFLPIIVSLTKENWLALVVLGIVFGMFLLLALILASVFASLMYNRVAYLTSRETAIPVSIKSLSSLFEYAKENFIQLLKLTLLNILVAFCIVAFFALIIVLASYLPLQDVIKIGIIILFGIFAALIFLIMGVVFGTAFVLFFMGNEKTGILKLVRMGWRVFKDNVVEYILFGLAYLATYVVYLAVTFGLGMLCLGPLSYIFAFIYSFYILVAFFVFIEKISEKSRKQKR